MSRQLAPLSAEDVARFGADPETAFRENLAEVEGRIARACALAGRERSDVRLQPITKTVPANVLRYAYAAGVRSFGENKIQEAMGKREVMADLDIHWSIVGHLQTNKVKYLTRFAHEFHALDSLRLAEELERRLERDDRFLDVYVQVNTSAEDSKFGLHPDALPSFAEALHRFARLRPQGLMTLALFSSEIERVRPCFELLRSLRDRAVAINPALTGLSMGMSGDYELAIAEGATVVRVGQAIFGKRPTPDSHYWPGFAQEAGKCA